MIPSDILVLVGAKDGAYTLRRLKRQTFDVHESGLQLMNCRKIVRGDHIAMNSLSLGGGRRC